MIIMPGTVPTLEHAMKLEEARRSMTSCNELGDEHGIRIVTWSWTPGGFAAKDREITGPGGPGTEDGAADPTFESS